MIGARHDIANGVALEISRNAIETFTWRILSTAAVPKKGQTWLLTSSSKGMK
jgi:hypothetical protein